jgi:hypothetical protein
MVITRQVDRGKKKRASMLSKIYFEKFASHLFLKKACA